MGRAGRSDRMSWSGASGQGNDSCCIGSTTAGRPQGCSPVVAIVLRTCGPRLRGRLRLTRIRPPVALPSGLMTGSDRYLCHARLVGEAVTRWPEMEVRIMFHSEAVARAIHADRVRDLERASRDHRLIAAAEEQSRSVRLAALPTAARPAAKD